eukprot:scaffold114998_cov42-Phaeocystis_antarctica.AAC.2
MANLGQVIAVLPFIARDLALSCDLLHLGLDALQLVAEETLVHLELRLACSGSVVRARARARVRGWGWG